MAGVAETAARGFHSNTADDRNLPTPDGNSPELRRFWKYQIPRHAYPTSTASYGIDTPEPLLLNP
jgi:hypothetical protein